MPQELTAAGFTRVLARRQRRSHARDSPRTPTRPQSRDDAATRPDHGDSGRACNAAMFNGRTEAGHEHELRSRERVRVRKARRGRPRRRARRRRCLDARRTAEPSTLMARTTLPTKERTRVFDGLTTPNQPRAISRRPARRLHLDVRPQWSSSAPPRTQQGCSTRVPSQKPQRYRTVRASQRRGEAKTS